MREIINMVTYLIIRSGRKFYDAKMYIEYDDAYTSYMNEITNASMNQSIAWFKVDHQTPKIKITLMVETYTYER